MLMLGNTGFSHMLSWMQLKGSGEGASADFLITKQMTNLSFKLQETTTPLLHNEGV